MKTYGVGIIGFGGFGQFLYHCWSGMPGVQVVAVADEDAAKMAALQGVTVHRDWKALLSMEQIDLLAIVTPPATHRTIASACMEAGKHVLIEKPLATTLADARHIIRVRERTGVVAAVDLIMRFNPLVRALRDLAAQGAFGRLRRVCVENYAQDDQLPAEHWFWDREVSGGILVEHGVHFIDLVHFIWPADVLQVNGLSHFRNPGQEDQVVASMVYEGGLVATHYHAFSRPGFFEKTRIHLAWDLADIDLHGWIPLRAEVSALVDERTRHLIASQPLFTLHETSDMAAVADASRPEGWGSTSQGRGASVTSGGITYAVDQVMSGTFDIGRSKQEVYADCVRAALRDALAGTADPAHQLTAPLEPAAHCLDLALQASSQPVD